MALLAGFIGGFLGTGLFWFGRRGWPAFVAGAVGFIVGGLVGGSIFLTLEPDSKSDKAAG
jgi:hypothetical protein